MPLPRYFGTLPDIAAVHLQSIQIDSLHCHARCDCFLHIARQKAFSVSRKLLAPSHALINCLLHLFLAQAARLVHRHVLEDELRAAGLLLEGDNVRVQSFFVVLEMAVIFCRIFAVSGQEVYPCAHFMEMDGGDPLREVGKAMNLEAVLVRVL